MKLKPLLVLLGMFTCSWLNSYSQVFGHPGARWVFYYPGYGIFCGQSYQIAEYVSDTTILGIPSKTVKFTQKVEWVVNPGVWQTGISFRYFNVSGDTVSLFNPSDSTWQELYNFSVQVGDTVINPLGIKLNPFAETCPDSIPYHDVAVVVNTGSTLVSGELLRFYTVRFFTANQAPLAPDSSLQTFYERMITMNYWYPTDSNQCGISVECPNPDLLCYADNDWSTNAACNDISYFETVNVEEQFFSNIQIYPNPVSENLFIEGSGQDVYSILNMDGKVVLTSSSDIIHVENLANGVYILSNANRSWYKKIVKN